MYFQTDGEYHNLRTFPEVLATVAKLNAAHKVIVHTSLLETNDDEGRAALAKMARDNGGTFRFVKMADEDRIASEKAARDYSDALRKKRLANPRKP